MTWKVDTAQDETCWVRDLQLCFREDKWQVQFFQSFDLVLLLCFAGKGQVGEVWEAEKVKEEQTPKTECSVGI